MVLYPSTYHHSPSSAETTLGSRSSRAPPRPVHRSGGSMMCESDETNQVSCKEAMGVANNRERPRATGGPSR